MSHRTVPFVALAGLALLFVSLGAVNRPPPPPPFKAQANMLLANPFPGDPDLAPTLVTLHITNQRWPDALRALDDATHCQHDTRTAGSNLDARVTLALDNAPMMEALYQIMGQGSVRAEPMPVPTPSIFKGSTIQDPYGRPTSPIWCISGPFSFLVQSIEHEVQLGTPNAETLRINLQADMEPRLHLLRAPEAFTLLEALDDKGHSLLPAKPDLGLQDLRLFARLEVPADSGKRIASLKGSLNYALQTKSETLEIDLTKFTAPFVKEVGGIEVTINPPTGPTPAGFQTFAFSFRRTTLAADRWTDTAKALAAAKPLMLLEKGNETRWPLDRNGKVQGDVVTHNWDFSPAVTPIPASKLVLTIPVETRTVTVPFAFKDLPLP